MAPPYQVGFNSTPRLKYTPFCTSELADQTQLGTGTLLPWQVSIDNLDKHASSPRATAGRVALESQRKRKATQEAGETPVASSKCSNVAVANDPIAQFDKSPFRNLVKVDSSKRAVTRFGVKSLSWARNFSRIYGYLHRQVRCTQPVRKATSILDFASLIGVTAPNVTLHFCADQEIDIDVLSRLELAMEISPVGVSLAKGFFIAFRAFVDERLAGSCMFLPVPHHLLDPEQPQDKLIALPLCTTEEMPHAMFADTYNYARMELDIMSVVTLRVMVILLHIVRLYGCITVCRIPTNSTSTGSCSLVDISYNSLAQIHEACSLQARSRFLHLRSREQRTLLYHSYAAVRDHLRAFVHKDNRDCYDNCYRTVWTCPCCIPQSPYRIAVWRDATCIHIKAAYYALHDVMQIPPECLRWNQAWCSNTPCDTKLDSCTWIRLPRDTTTMSKLLSSVSHVPFNDADHWRLCYHGTSCTALGRILASGIRPAGIRSLGKQIRTAGSRLGPSSKVFTSPSFLYAALFSTQHYITLDGAKRIITIVLECRILSNCFDVIPETLGAIEKGVVLDKHYDNNELEWRTDQCDSVIVTAVWVSVGKDRPYAKILDILR